MIFEGFGFKVFDDDGETLIETLPAVLYTRQGTEDLVALVPEGVTSVDFLNDDDGSVIYTSSVVDGIAEFKPSSTGTFKVRVGEKTKSGRNVLTVKIMGLQSATQPSLSIDSYKNEKINELNNKCNQLIVEGFKSEALGIEHTYPSDEEAQRNLTMAIKRLELSPELGTINFKTIDAGYLPHTIDEIHSVFADGFDFGQSIIIKYNTLKNIVLNTETIEEVQAIIWED
jgi:hypothetical protein